MEKFFLFICLFIGTQSSVSAQCLNIPACPVATQAICDTTINSVAYWNDSLFFDPVVQSHDLSEGPTELSIQIVDTCATEELLASFVLLLDLNGDGIVETAVSSITPPEPGTVYYGNSNNPNYTGGEARLFDSRDVPTDQKYSFVLEKIVQDSLVTFRIRWANALNPNDYVLSELPYGTHLIRWRFQKSWDAKVCNSSFLVKDCQAPTVTCIPDLSVNLAPTHPVLIQLSATDFLEPTSLPSDNCTPPNQLQFGIRRAGTGTGFPANSPRVFFTCDDLGIQPVEVWVRDKAGNASFCTTNVIVQDNFGVCSIDTSPINICVKTACSNFIQGVEEVGFVLSGTHPALPPFSLFNWDSTNEDGCAMLDFSSSIPISVATLTVAPSEMNTQPLNGVTTYDLVLLSKHVNGIEQFTEDWQWVAADTDLNGIIDSVDLRNCRALIFGETDSIAYPGFRFYPLNYEFPAGNPLALPIPNYITLNSVDLGQPIQFAAVKACDFNCTSVTDVEEITATGKIGQPQPNPASAIFFIPLALEQSAVVKVEILDLTGRLLYQNTAPYSIGEQRLEIPASALPQTGMYIWRVQAGEESRAGKVVKQ